MPTYPTLFEVFTKKYNMPITPNRYSQVLKYCQLFELKKAHPLAFNSALLGVDKAFFLKPDYDMLFDIFDVNVLEFKHDLINTEHMQYLKNKIADSTNSVGCDAYNIFTVWLCYCVGKSSLPSSKKEQLIFTLLKMMYYKFFTSYVHYVFPYPPNPEIMQQTINSLSYKFDIKDPKTPTWKLVLEQKCKEFMMKNSPHYHTLKTFKTDKQVVYILTDVQTRIRVKIQTIVNVFYKVRDEAKLMKKTSMVTTNAEGEKFIKDIASISESLTANVSSAVLNINEFINYEHIKNICDISKNINKTLLRNVLTKFSDDAILQYKAGRQNEIVQKGSKTLYKGYNVFIATVIQKTYRLCTLDKEVNLKSKLSILHKTSNLYRSSRINDPDILAIKNSTEYYIDKYADITRESTKASLRIAFLQHIMVQSFKHM